MTSTLESPAADAAGPPTDTTTPAAPPRPAGVDARKHRRARAHWPVRLVTSTGAVASGWVCDVSEGGVGVLSHVNMPVGAVVEAALAVPCLQDPSRSVPLRCQVRVVFCAFVGVQSRLGLQFMALPTSARLAIRRYLLANT